MTDKPSLFSLRNYPAWFGADTFLLAGSAVHWVVVSLMAYQLSGSVTVAGWFSTARGVASALTQAMGGTFIDRHDHRTLILVQAGSCAALWLTMGLLFVLGRLTFALFATLCLTSSTIFGFLGGTTNAALITVVGPERYAEAESFNQGRDAAVNTAGSPLGAALYGISHAFPFFASALCDLLAFVCALRLRLPVRTRGAAGEGAPDNPARNRSFVGDLQDGWRWVLASGTIVHAVCIIGLCEFGSFALHQAINLQLVSVGTDALLISLSNVGMALGTMLGSLVSARLCNRVPVGHGVVLILVAMALAYVPMALAGTYEVIVLSTFLASLPMPLFSALVSGFVFSKTPVDKQGRTRAAIMTTLMLFASGSGALAGELLPRVGFGGFVLLMVGLILASAVVAAISPRIRAISASPDWPGTDL